MPARLSYIWQANLARSVSWTETFYTGVSTLAGAKSIEAAFAPILGNVHAPNVVYVGTRITMLNEAGHPSGISYLAEPLQASTGNVLRSGDDVSPTNNTDYPSTALLLRLTEVDGVETRQWLHGVDDGYVVSGIFQTGYRPGPIAALMAHLKSTTGGMVMRVRQLPATRFTISAVDFATQIVTTVEEHGVAARTRMVFGRVRQLRTVGSPINKFPRVWWVEPVTGQPRQLKVYGLNAWMETNNVLPGGWVRVDSYRAPLIDSARIMRATGRKVGGPFGG